MASMKKTTNFDEYWEFLKAEAASHRWTDGEFMKACKIPRQRYYEFGKSRSLTGVYMAKFMEGLGLTQETIEKRTGRRFSPDQIKTLRRGSWVAAHEDIIDGLVDFPDLIPIIKQQIELQKKR
mgnify:CR=1 FL=1